MSPVISLFGLPIPVAPLALIVAYIVGSELAERTLVRSSPNEMRVAWRHAFNSASALAFFGGLVSARLAYAVQNFQSYVQSPQLLFSLRPGTLAFLPGLVVAGAIIGLYLRRALVPFPRVADAAAVGATGALLILSLGDFLTGSNYGTAADLFWGVELWGAVRHPVQLYNALAMLVILGALWYIQPRVIAGELFWRFVLLYSLSQLVVNTFYANAATWGPGIRVGQIVALIALLVSIYILSLYAQFRERRGDGPSSDSGEHTSVPTSLAEQTDRSVTV